MTAVKDNRDLRRFELEEEGLTAFANYARNGLHVVIPYVEAPPALRGHGTAARLMEGIVARARAEGFRITPTCSYAFAWFKRHKNAQDVLA
ncbi:MAG: N-acetyltransferase [Alphaproteobacteria bacterium]|nr:N-acetyltransferase [Alphaproteobacteria bacterium]MBL7098349.1 N-acetyltransferase [Alphaproteobacteria bacterium]